MTKKDYEKFAEMLGKELWYNKAHLKLHPDKKSYIDGKRMELSFIIEATIKIFKDDNPRFDEKKFRETIGAYSIPVSEGGRL